ncbi:gypsy/ty3 retroelement polyprotein, partial [Tanacetum coccineum]
KRVVGEIPKKDDTTESDVDNDDEHRKCLKIVTFKGTIDIEVMETKSIIARLDKVSSPDGDYLVIYRANGNFRAFNYLIEVLHIFDRKDLYHLYNLMMEQYSEITLEGIELILWGDLKIMMESSTEENNQSDLCSNQQDWKIVTWRLYKACGVCILEFEDGTVIYMAKGQCFYYDQKFVQGHKCSGQLHSKEVICEGDIDNCIDGDDDIYEDCVGEIVGVTDTPQITLNALFCLNSNQTMRIIGRVDKQVVHILIDCGRTHNFLDIHTAKKLGCKLAKTTPMQVSVANGQRMMSTSICHDLK